MPYIYKITNDINNKVYIGKTLKTVEERWQEHCHDACKERCEKRPLYSAINKYGQNHFKIEPIEECSIENINEREQFWIDYYNCCGHNGYNATFGGDGKPYLDYDLIYQTYQQVKSCKQTAEIVGCNYDSVRDILRNVFNVSKQEIEQNRRDSISHSVIMIDKNTNEPLQTFRSVREAERYLQKEGINSHISAVCNGKRKTAYGYKWAYAENVE